MNSPPKVTVFIPVFNREKYIGKTLESILTQSFSNFELLVVDDGSTDRSVEIIQSYNDPRIRLHCNPTNLGIPTTRNKGLELARGHYIALLDSDDVSDPRRLEKQVIFLDQNPDYVQIGSWCRMIDAQGQPLKRVRKQPTGWEDVHAHLLFRCALTNRSIMGRTAIFQEYGYRTDFPRCQDYDLHVRLSTKFKMGNLPEYLVFGRIHAEQITNHTQDIGDSKKKIIIGGQLDRLGVEFSQNDLSSHLLLTRLRKSKFIPEHEYLEWAHEWLSTIQRANLQSSLYPQRALSRTIKKIWLRACWAAQPNVGIKFLHFSAKLPG